MRNLSVQLILSLFLVFGLSSCLEIYETVTFRKDGSGHMEIKTDFSKMKEMMESLKTMNKEADSENGEAEEDPFASIGSSTEEDIQKLSGLSGISNVIANWDKESFIYVLSYDFADINALNSALNAGAGQKEIAGIDFHGHNATGPVSFVWKKGELVRNFKTHDSEMSEEDESSMDMAKMFFDESAYHYSYTFEGSVKKVKKGPEGYTVDGKTVTGKFPIFDLLDENKSHVLDIKHK